MSNRNLIASLFAVILLSLICVCGAGAFVLFGAGTNIAALQQGAPSVTLPQSEEPIQTVPDESAVVREEPVEEIPRAPRATVAPLDLPTDGLSLLQLEENVVNQIYEAVSPSVVNVSVGGGSESVLGVLGEGSGFVWDQEGHIVTNNHVVEGAGGLFITFSDGLQVPGEVVGTDPDSDLAVVKVNVAPERLSPVRLGDSEALRVGQRVIAIGNPFGFDGTLTLGVVSAVGRTVPGRDAFRLTNLVQTDAAINPGNSGGPLLDINGRVVGVNTLIFSSTQANSGVGFAVPVNKVRAVVPSLIATGAFETPYLGVQAFSIPLTPELAQTLQLENVTRGVLVQQVVDGGPADQAGLRSSTRQIEFEGTTIQSGGDVIIAIDNQPVDEFDDLVNYLDTRRVGQDVTLRVVRDGEEMDVVVTLGARP